MRGTKSVTQDLLGTVFVSACGEDGANTENDEDEDSWSPEHARPSHRSLSVDTLVRLRLAA